MKNKLAPPFKTAEFDIIYGEGISQTGCLVDLGVEYGILEKSGSWYSYNGEKIAQGRDKAKDYVAQNPGFKAELDRLIREKAAGKTAPEQEAQA